jgi:beta-N-acetylhexosaminidase
VSGDTHLTEGLTPTFSDISSYDIEPYRLLAGQVAETDVSVMIGHLMVPGLTDGVRAARSPAAVRYLRDDLGYSDALLRIDALGMAAVGLPEPEASVLAVEAGIDVVIFTRTAQAGPVVDAIVAAVASGRISDAQVTQSAMPVTHKLELDGHTCSAPKV